MKSTQRLAAAFAMLAILVLDMQLASAQKWGTLTGRFVLEGTAPAMKLIDTAASNDAYCRMREVPEELIVTGEGGGLANVVIYLRPARGKKVDVHPDYEATAGDDVSIDNKDCRFQPHVLVMRTSQTLVIKNSDGTAHNSRLSPLNPRNPGINPLIPANGDTKYKFNVEENLPVAVGCNIHPWMAAHIVVRDNPYAAVSGPDGKFVIENMPVGKHEFQLKHADTVYISKAKMDGKAVQWRSGRPTFEVKEGMNDLGDIEVPLDLLKK
jgi:hypothetical protein